MAERIAWWLIMIGALNWLVVGLFRFNAVAYVFGGSDELFSRIVYILIGLAGVYLLPQAFGVKMIQNKHK